MPDLLPLRQIRFIATEDAVAHSTGLLGFVSFVVNDSLFVDGVTLRRTRDGRLALSFPVRHDAAGRPHALVRPLNDEARRALQAQVFSALNLKQETGP